MIMEIKDFSNEVKFQVGQRVYVDLKEIPKKERNCETGVVKTIYTKFLRTSKLRTIMYQVAFDEPYIKGDKVCFGQIHEIRTYADHIKLCP